MRINPFFSIVIVNYNTGKYLEQAIQSVINQSCPDWELIMVDGGSTDNSLDVIKRYSTYFSWWISEPDHGQSDAFNKGFSHANGVFYTWLNADDIMLSGTLAYVKEYIVKHQSCNWVALNTIYFDGAGRILSCSQGVSHNNFVLKHGVLTEVAPSTIFHSDLYNESNRFDTSLHYTMDTDLWIQFVNNGHSYKRVNKFGWGFRLHDDSKTASSVLQRKYMDKHKKEYISMLRKNGVMQYVLVLFWQKVLRVLYSRPLMLYFSFIYKGRIIYSIK